ncbi:hypothetical protein LAJ19_20940 (plasmid) [Deinococcus taeanensis]|uniref:AAA family ATPase n=1 Tax=Deinococcus taeanensis TaxID=2737050 RepID=UPI001CDC4DB8|nr:hypothetical protein LAJ19_20940 [Deinococcus taeanensis]
MGQADAAWSATLRLGSAEGTLPLTQAIISVATAPKSNAAYRAITQALGLARQHPHLTPPLRMMNARTDYQAALRRKRDDAYNHKSSRPQSGQTPGETVTFGSPCPALPPTRPEPHPHRPPPHAGVLCGGSAIVKSKPHVEPSTFSWPVSALWCHFSCSAQDFHPRHSVSL